MLFWKSLCLMFKPQRSIFMKCLQNVLKKSENSENYTSKDN